MWPRQSSLSAVEIDSFLTPNLRHHSHSVDTLRACPEVADWVKETYGLLTHAMEEGESSSFYDDLDEISSKFDEACHAFGRLVTAEEKKLELVQQQQVSTRAELDCELQQLHQTQARLEQSESQLHQTQARLEQSESQLHQTQARLEQSEGQLHHTQAQLEQSQTWITAMESSKFWKLRAKWFRVKTTLGIKKPENHGKLGW